MVPQLLSGRAWDPARAVLELSLCWFSPLSRVPRFRPGSRTLGPRSASLLATWPGSAGSLPGLTASGSRRHSLDGQQPASSWGGRCPMEEELAGGPGLQAPRRQESGLPGLQGWSNLCWLWAPHRNEAPSPGCSLGIPIPICLGRGRLHGC